MCRWVEFVPGVFREEPSHTGKPDESTDEGVRLLGYRVSRGPDSQGPLDEGLGARVFLKSRRGSSCQLKSAEVVGIILQGPLRDNKGIVMSLETFVAVSEHQERGPLLGFRR